MPRNFGSSTNLSDLPFSATTAAPLGCAEACVGAGADVAADAVVGAGAEVGADVGAGACVGAWVAGADVGAGAEVAGAAVGTTAGAHAANTTSAMAINPTTGKNRLSISLLLLVLVYN